MQNLCLKFVLFPANSSQPQLAQAESHGAERHFSSREISFFAFVARSWGPAVGRAHLFLAADWSNSPWDKPIRAHRGVTWQLCYWFSTVKAELQSCMNGSLAMMMEKQWGSNKVSPRKSHYCHWKVCLENCPLLSNPMLALSSAACPLCLRLNYYTPKIWGHR